MPTTSPSSNGKAAAPAGSSRLPRARRWGNGAKALAAAGALVLVFASGGGAYLYLSGLHSIRTDLVTYTVHPDKLQLTITERGALESSENSDITCRVKAGSKNSTVSTTIKWVLDDGSHVKKGDRLIELDDSGLQEQLKTERITLDKSEADKIQSEENYKIVESQNQSDIIAAENLVKLTEIDLEKYIKGDYEQSKKDTLGQIKNAESDLEQCRERAAWADRMVKKGYQTPSQAQAEQSRLQSTEITLAKWQEALRVLDDYTYKRTVTDLTSKVEEAKRALERVHIQAKAKQAQAEGDRKAKRSIYEQQLAHCQDIEEEIRKCTIDSPQDGMVVYYVPEQSRYGSGSQQSIIAQGEPVREGQKLMRIPDLSKMLVNTKVHEAMVSKVKGEEWQNTGFGHGVRSAILTSPDLSSRILALAAFGELRDKFKDKIQRCVYGGQRASIRVEAFPDRLLQGHVKTVATVASQQDWMSADIKVYQTMVSIDEPLDGLKPGMSAEVTISVDASLENVLTIPIQAIMGSPVMGKQRECYVLLPDGSTEKRQIVVGMSNTKMAEIKSGLEEGDQVVLNPRALLSDKEKAKLAETADKAGKGGDKAGRKGGPGAGPGGPDGKRGDWPGKGPNGFDGSGPEGKGGDWPGKGRPVGRPGE
jgi:multidrug efflux pump subunit AcrA (membrane-fusion protein)